MYEDELYLLALTRYIHLNPVRSKVVTRLAELRRYPWTDHAALLDRVARSWQATATALAHCGRRRRPALARCEAFVAEGIPHGRRPTAGGGRVRSRGGWALVLPLRRRGRHVASDARVLRSGSFVECLRGEATRLEKETLRLSEQVVDLATVAETVSGHTTVPEAQLRSGSRRPEVVRAPRLFYQVAVKAMGHSGATVARFRGVTTSAANRLAVSEAFPEQGRILKSL